MKMNERIRELFDRAEHQALKHLGSDWEVYVEPSREQIFEKFAELIVKECEKVIRAEIAVTDIDGEAERAWEMGMECGVGLIKTHFGVEE